MNALFSLTDTGIIKLEMESSMVTETNPCPSFLETHGSSKFHMSKIGTEAIQEEAVETYLRSRELKIWSLARS